MKKKILLHIGLHKTGTTAFQQTIRRNFKHLRDNSFFVCPSDTVIRGNGGLHIIPREFKRNGTSEALDNVLDLFEESNCHTGIISSEVFDSFKINEVKDISKRLELYEVIICIVFRHPISLISSAFCSAGGFVRDESPEQFVHSFLKNKDYIYFGKFFKRWNTYFNNFYILFHENYDDIVSALLEHMRLPSSVYEQIKLQKIRYPNNILEESFGDGRARKSLSPKAAIINYLLSDEIKKRTKDEKILIHKNLLKFDALYKKENAGRSGDSKVVLLSKKTQKRIINRLRDDFTEFIQVTKMELPNSYYFPIEGVVPKVSEMESLYNRFVGMTDNFQNEEKK